MPVKHFWRKYAKKVPTTLARFRNWPNRNLLKPIYSFQKCDFFDRYKGSRIEQYCPYLLQVLLTVTMAPKSAAKVDVTKADKPKADNPTDRLLAKESTELLEKDTVLLKHGQAVEAGW